MDCSECGKEVIIKPVFCEGNACRMRYRRKNAKPDVKFLNETIKKELSVKILNEVKPKVAKMPSSAKKIHSCPMYPLCKKHGSSTRTCGCCSC